MSFLETRNWKYEARKFINCHPVSSLQHLTSSRGFTLVELLITTLLMTLVAGTLVAVLGAGLRVWKRTTMYGIQEQNALIAYEQFRKDLHTVVSFSNIPFEGGYDEFSFASIGKFGGNAGLPREIGQTHYYLDRHANRLCRSFLPYRSLKQQRNQEPCQVIFHDVQRIRFRYLGKGWSSRWESEDLPMAVNISVTVKPKEKSASVHSFIVDVPQASLPKEES